MARKYDLISELQNGCIKSSELAGILGFGLPKL